MSHVLDLRHGMSSRSSDRVHRPRMSSDRLTPVQTDPSQVHGASLAEGEWKDSGRLADPIDRGGVRLTVAETFEVARRKVTRDAAILDLVEFAGEDSGTKRTACRTITNPRVVRPGRRRDA
jgi:hypothetical protein